MTYFKLAIEMLASGIVVALLYLVAASSGRNAVGWRKLRPSVMHWAVLIFGTGLVLVMTYVRLFVGSSRPDAETQMNILTGLIFAFSVLLVVAMFGVIAIRRRSICWYRSRIAFNGKSGTEMRNFDDIVDLRWTFADQVILTFRDKSTLRVDPYATGAGDLVEEINEALAAARIDATIAELTQRLFGNPDDLEGWMMLIESRAVRQGESAAKDALAQAEKVFAGRGELEQLRRFAVELGLR